MVPGFIDIHGHGGGGNDTLDGTYEAINNIAYSTIDRDEPMGFLRETFYSNASFLDLEAQLDS